MSRRTGAWLVAGAVAAVAFQVVVSVASSSAPHVGNMFAKLCLEPAAEDHRRVLAVLTYLRR